MDVVLKASSLLLLLTLSLNVHLYSSGPIPASDVAEEAGPAEEAPVPVIPVEAPEDGPPEDMEEETAVLENASPDQDDLLNPDPADAMPIDPVEAVEDKASEEAAPEDMLLIIPDDHAIDVPQEPLAHAPEEEKSDVIVPSESEEPDQEEPVVVEIAPVEPVPEEPAEEEEHVEEEEAVILEDPLTDEEPEEESVILPEESDEEDLDAYEEHLASSPDAEEFVPVEEVQEETTSEEPVPEDPVLILPLEDQEEETPVEETEEQVVHSDLLLEEPEDIMPQENELHESLPEILIVAVTETPSESNTTEMVLDPVEEVPVAATETVTEAPAERFTDPAPTVADAQEEDFKTAVTLTAEALMNRGAALEAGLFTLLLFVTIGFV
ncbi:hypothetical protein INR49_029748 [Caranx melampygus]|nr:hypothetical protein INR49_029748 [Caranx melampygus]